MTVAEPRAFDHLSPELAATLHETLADLREREPVAWSDEHGGFWVVTGYEDVLRVAQDWRTFSSAEGVNVPAPTTPVNAIPEVMDPPLHREFKRLINAWFTPKVVARYEDGTRALVARLIDGFVADGRCEFMDAFARPLPGLAFFDHVLHAPADDVGRLNDLATVASTPGHPQRAEAWQGMAAWITDLVAARRAAGPVGEGDVVDAVLAAEIEGRPITDHEILGVIQLLILGGLETTAGALGQFMIRFCAEPAIPELLAERPDLLPSAVEELLRLDPPFIAIARVATCDTEIGGQAIAAGQRVLVYWASANRDEAEFACPHAFDLDRESNRHLSFGAGPHRCAGSNLARMNLRIALEELLRRLHDVRLAEGARIEYHSVLNRSPHSVPITFTPGPRITTPA
ncbi:MAG TPA: cytochrome P450 [Acidimicrobiales bacterium]|nr:cytochrome P450 [Acidimicrobiales bacterium]